MKAEERWLRCTFQQLCSSAKTDLTSSAFNRVSYSLPSLEIAASVCVSVSICLHLSVVMRSSSARMGLRTHTPTHTITTHTHMTRYTAAAHTHCRWATPHATPRHWYTHTHKQQHRQTNIHTHTHPAHTHNNNNNNNTHTQNLMTNDVYKGTRSRGWRTTTPHPNKTTWATTVVRAASYTSMHLCHAVRPTLNKTLTQCSDFKQNGNNSQKVIHRKEYFTSNIHALT